jgi:hypothetical protein
MLTAGGFVARQSYSKYTKQRFSYVVNVHAGLKKSQVH